MRIRLEATLGQAVENLARVQNRTPQNMAARLLFKGLAAEGHHVAAPVRPFDANETTADVHVPLPGPAFAKIKELARAEDRSNRSMMRQIMKAGLAAYGAWPPAADDSPAAT